MKNLIIGGPFLVLGAAYGLSMIYSVINGQEIKDFLYVIPFPVALILVGVLFLANAMPDTIKRDENR